MLEHITNSSPCRPAGTSGLTSRFCFCLLFQFIQRRTTACGDRCWCSVARHRRLDLNPSTSKLCFDESRSSCKRRHSNGQSQQRGRKYKQINTCGNAASKHIRSFLSGCLRAARKHELGLSVQGQVLSYLHSPLAENFGSL